MTTDQVLILLILAVTVGLFLWGRWRHDVVALACLLACVFAGLVPATQAFSGFGHPAVITVACVLVLSWALQSTGAVDLLAHKALPTHTGPALTIASITALGAVLSAFMNNVGAMALLMPVAIQMARRLDMPPGKILMPLAFGTILGGMTTLIGTPPNLIVSGFRDQAFDNSFAMFDFAPVGVAVAVVGIAFTALLGWRLVPTRDKQDETSFDTGTYLTEVRVPENSKSAGKTLRALERNLEKADAQVIGMIRNDFRINAPNARRLIRAGDILIIEAEPETLSATLSKAGLALHEHDDSEAAAAEVSEDGEIVLRELTVMPGSRLIGRSSKTVRLRTRYGLNLLALSRQGRRSIHRLRSTQIKAGDVLLMQGPPGAITGFASDYGCVPLAGRDISIPDRRNMALSVIIMAGAIGGAAFGLLPAAISFATGVLALMVLRVVPLRRIYDAVDWPVVVLLAALIPVAFAMESTGAADLIAGTLLGTLARGHPVVALVLVLVVTMTLSDLMNNAATAAVMAPVAISSAAQLGVNADTFLMAVAVGASCAFLTPIGHQNNTLILGPGGFRFGDYWRLGLPMELIVVVVGIPVLLVAWPL